MLRTTVVLLILLGITAMSAIGAEKIVLDTVRAEVTPLAGGTAAERPQNWAAEGAAQTAGLWRVERFTGNLLLHARVRLPQQPEALLTVFLCASLPDGRDLLEQARRPEPLPMDGLRSYAVTFSPSKSGLTARLHKTPSALATDEAIVADAPAGQPVALDILKAGQRIKVFLNQRPLLDWWDMGEDDADTSLSDGYLGLRARGAPLQLDNFRAARVESWSMTPIAALKPLRLETDLSQARIVTGAAPSHARAAATIAAAIKERTGRTPEVVKDADALNAMPSASPLIVLGNLADNLLVRKLYFEWFTIVDRRFPGPGGTFVQTIHNPYGNGANIVVVGASDDAGLAAATAKFVNLIPPNGRIGRLYDVAPSPEYAALADWITSPLGTRLITPVGWPLRFALAWDASRDDPRQTGILYLLTGREELAKLYRDQMLRITTADSREKQIAKGVIYHLYVVGWMELWDLLEEHPVFSDADRLTLTNWFLSQMRSGQCIGSLHLQRCAWGMPHQNHGTRPSLGTFFMARYFQRQYGLAECDVYLRRVARYFDMQADWSKPMCDSSMHQWEATLENKATYALASGQERFFTSGAARQAAERALRTSNNVGLLPVFGDAQYGSGAHSLLAKAAFYYGDGRYLWPIVARENIEHADSDELLRGFAGDVAPVEPKDIVGVSVSPYDNGFWRGWRNLPKVKSFTPPNVPYEKAFDKIAFRTGLKRDDEFLLLDGMIGASHDYDDTNTIHEYSRRGRTYLVTYDGLPSSTMARHNGLNIIREGLSTDVPSCAERLYAADLGRVMVSQTRVNDFGDTDWTRTILLRPGRYFVVVDRVRARQPGAFTLAGHWRTLGEPEFAGQTLTVKQWPKGEKSNRTNTTHFHLQTPADRVSHERLPSRYGLGARYYPYARLLPNVLEFGKTPHLRQGASEFLCTLGHETGYEPKPRFALFPALRGVVRVAAAEQDSAYMGAPEGPVEIGIVRLDADLVFLDGETVCVAGGRRVVVAGETVLDAPGGVTVAIELATGKVLSGSTGGPVKALSADARRALQEQLRSVRFDRPAVSRVEGRTAADLPVRWQFKAGGKVQHLRTVQGNPGAHLLPGEGAALPDGFGLVAVPSAAGHVTFLDAAGAAVRRLDAGVPVNDVAIDDVDGDGRWEILVARDDCRLQCLDAATGEVRFDFAPKREPPANSTLQLGRNQAVYVFVAELRPGAGKTLCVATGDQRLHGVNAKGERLWTFWSYAGIFGIHGLVDIAGGKAIVGGNPVLSSTDVVYFLKGGDTYARRVHLDGWGSTLSSLAIADMNGDGKSEILVGTGRGSLYALAADSDSPLWRVTLGDDVRGVGIARGDRGGRFVAAGSLSGFVTAFSAHGKKLWATALGAPVRFLAIAPGQPRDAIVAALADGTVTVLSPDGALTHAAKLPAAPSAFALARPKDGPGLVLVAGEDNVVRALALPVAR